MTIDSIMEKIVRTQEEKDKIDEEWEEKRKEWLNSFRYD